MDKEDEFVSKCVEGLLLGFFNQGEVCTCPSRALVQESIYEQFIEMVLQRAGQMVARQSSGHGHHDWRTGIARAIGQNLRIHEYRAKTRVPNFLSAVKGRPLATTWQGAITFNQLC